MAKEEINPSGKTYEEIIDYFIRLIDSKLHIDENSIRWTFNREFGDVGYTSSKILADMISLGLNRTGELNNHYLTEKGLKVLNTKGGYPQFKIEEEKRLKKKDEYLQVQLSLASKTNKIFWITTAFGFIGGLLGIISFALNLDQPTFKELKNELKEKTVLIDSLIETNMKLKSVQQHLKDTAKLSTQKK